MASSSTLELLFRGSTHGPRIPVALFDHYADAGNVSTDESDLYSDSLAAGQLYADGQKLIAEYGGIFVSSATATRQLRAYFGGTAIFDSGALSISAGADAWDMRIMVIRASATVARCIVAMNLSGAATTAFCAYTAVTATLADAQILKVTGQAAGVGAATNDIVAKAGMVEWKAAA